MSNISNPKRILIFSHDNKIGDAVLLNSLIAPLKQKWPQCLIDVVAGKDNSAIWQANPNIHYVAIIPSRSVISRLWCGLKLSKNPYSIAIVTSGEHQGKSFSVMRLAARIKQVLWISTVSKGNNNDISVIQNWDAGHYLDRCQAVIDRLINSQVKIKTELFIPDSAKNFAIQYWSKTNSSQHVNILLNAGASSNDHRWSTEKVKLISDCVFSLCPNVILHIISQNSHHASELESVIKASKHLTQIYIIPPRKNILDIAALIQGCNVLISPNTFAIHMASASNTPVIAAYIAKSTVISWGPRSEVNRVLMANEKLENIDPTLIAQSLSEILKDTSH